MPRGVLIGFGADFMECYTSRFPRLKFYLENQWYVFVLCYESEDAGFVRLGRGLSHGFDTIQNLSASWTTALRRFTVKLPNVRCHFIILSMILKCGAYHNQIMRDSLCFISQFLYVVIRPLLSDTIPLWTCNVIHLTIGDERNEALPTQIFFQICHILNSTRIKCGRFMA
jgi:hypothetical protein